MESASPEKITCPACGGAGGGPFGPAGSAWDDEAYVCPRCEGAGKIALAEDGRGGGPRPGIVKAVPGEIEAPAKKQKSG